MHTFETIKCEQSGAIVTVTLNRPKLNLFNEQMIEELIQVWHDLRKNKTARFVILTAQGDHFSAGIDLQAYGTGEFTAEDARRQQLAGHELMRSLESVEQVTVAVLRGIVCGAGMAVAQACDFRIMTGESYFVVPETNIGTYYTWGCTPRLVRMVGASKAMEIIMTCDPIPAQEAYRLNLANKVVPEDALMQATHDFIAKIASRSPTCIRITKKIALGASMEGFGNMFICEPELMQEVVYTGETQEGIEAFLEKRPAKFTS
ncbi:MAG: enoyl-CoA hydratase/isomerase family protein [Deltaproteobacteria bacterium]|nr:enoyl-CoA hydratase/isomerase family protein [Deltaproteobacteria bacterium]